MQLLRKKGMLDSTRVLFLPVDDIFSNPDQPRRVFAQGDLEELGPVYSGSGTAPAADGTAHRGRLGAGGGRTAAAGGQAGRTAGGPLPLSANRQPALLPAGAGGKLTAQRPGLLGGVSGVGQADFHLPPLPGGGRPADRQEPISGSQQAAAAEAPREVLEILRDGGATERHARARCAWKTPSFSSRRPRPWWSSI